MEFLYAIDGNINCYHPYRKKWIFIIFADDSKPSSRCISNIGQKISNDSHSIELFTIFKMQHNLYIY